MTTAVLSEQIQIGESVREQVRATTRHTGARLVLQMPNGSTVALPNEVDNLVTRVMAAMARGGSVQISSIPEQLTSTAAAGILGVSRPTLKKWAREGLVDSFQVGTHTRFRRDDIMELRDRREAERREAIDELMAFDIENEDLLDG